MAVGALGTTSTTALNAIVFNPRGTATSISQNTLTDADLSAIAQSIVGDGEFSASKPTGVLATGSTHSTTTLDTLVQTAGGALAAIEVGDIVLGVGIPPGTFVTAKPTSTSVTLSQAATATASAVRIGFVHLKSSGRLSFEGRLEIPGGRGLVIVKPGDVVAVDNTGWPIVVSAASIAYAGSLWNSTAT